MGAKRVVRILAFVFFHGEDVLAVDVPCVWHVIELVLWLLVVLDCRDRIVCGLFALRIPVL
jgi:hypothetical protein